MTVEDTPALRYGLERFARVFSQARILLNSAIP